MKFISALFVALALCAVAVESAEARGCRRGRSRGCSASSCGVSASISSPASSNCIGGSCRVR